jgi:hypothetical protein
MSGPIARAILQQTAADHGLPVAVMLEKSRSPDRVAARFDAMRRLRSITRLDGKPRFSLPQIGAVLGMHHTTVLNGLRRIEALAPVETAATSSSLSSSSPHPQHSSPPCLSRGQGIVVGAGANSDGAVFPDPRNKCGDDEVGGDAGGRHRDDGNGQRP